MIYLDIMNGGYAGKIQALDLNLYADLFEDIQKDRSKRRMLAVIEAAIQVYSTKGVEHSTYEMIAETAGVSRTVVLHYFKDKEDLFLMAVKYIRVNFQDLAIQEFKKHSDPVNMLSGYVRCIFIWLKKFPKHCKTWMFYLYLCSKNRKERNLNTELVSVGHLRIQALIELGISKNRFTCSNPQITAKMIQTLMSGIFITFLAENETLDLRALETELVYQCLAMVGVNSSTSHFTED
jgi:AcrR family transcriptional regulator